MIESYEFGEMIIDGRRYTSDLIVYPNRVDDSWWRKTSHELGVEDLVGDIMKEKPDTVVIGKGYYGYMKVLPETKNFFESKGTKLIEQDTGKAFKTFNELSKKEKVIGLFHLTC
jgi:hypothetical protein